MEEELSAVIEAAEVNLSNVLMNKGPYSSLWPNSSMTTAADRCRHEQRRKLKKITIIICHFLKFTQKPIIYMSYRKGQQPVKTRKSQPLPFVQHSQLHTTHK